MIKKILGSLIITCLFSIGFSSALRIYPIGLYANNIANTSIDFQITNKGMFLSQSAGITKKLLWLDEKSYMFWNENGLPYFLWSTTLQGIIPEYMVCDELIPDGNVVISLPGNCTTFPVNSSSYEYFGSFFNNLTDDDYWGFQVSNDWDYYVCISSSSLGNSLCFNMNRSTDYYDSVDMPYNQGFSSVNNSLLYDPPFYVPGDLPDNPSTPGIGVGGIELGSDESAINYFENRYGRNKDICYAGIDNVTSIWGSSVSFQEGTGLDIFQVFSGINNMSPDLDKVYVRLNSWLINYEQWFGRSGDPLYLSNYNTGTNQVDLYYDNLTFPFANNPVAVYFLASNISVHSEYSTMGSEIVSYCNLKINDGNFDEIIDQAVKNNIIRYTEQENRNNGLSSSGTVVNIDFSDLVYTGDAFISSGVEIAFSGNTTLKNTLKEFFTTFDNALDGLDINTTNRILPTWLVSAFLFVVLFNFLRKRK